MAMFSSWFKLLVATSMLVLLFSGNVCSHPSSENLKSGRGLESTEIIDSLNDGSEADVSQDYNNDDADDTDDEEDGYSEDKGDESDDDDGPPAEITSTSLEMYFIPGNTVWLPCNAKNDKNVVILWDGPETKNQNRLFQGSHRLSKDSRIEMNPNNKTLIIRGLRADDAGNYTCSLSTGGTLQHVLKLARVSQIDRIEPSHDRRLVPIGGPLRLECFASGDPKPNVTWSLRGSSIINEKSQFGQQHVLIPKVTLDDSGMYQCLATNGYGKPAVGAVDIKILYPPKVHIGKSVVNTNEGYEAVLSCSVKSNPGSNIEWKRDGHEIHNGNHHHRISHHKDGNHSTLRISNVTVHDFGTYTCKASNNQGSDSGHIELVRQPGRALWVSGSQNADSNPQLKWTVESVQPITELELVFFKIDETKPKELPDKSEWKVEKPDITNPEGNKYTVIHSLANLTPGKYAAQLRAKNTHGWGQVSEPHTFDGDYETNEIRQGERLEEAAVAEVGSGALGKRSSHSEIATLFLTLMTYCLVRIL